LPPSTAFVATPILEMALMLAPLLVLTAVIPTGLRLHYRVVVPGVMARAITGGKRCRRIVARLMMALLVAMAAVMAIMTVITRHDINGVRLRAVIGGRIMTIMTAISIATAAVYRATG
jgi:hypothetical protein